MRETLTRWEGKGVREVKNNRLHRAPRSLVKTNAERRGGPASGLEIADAMPELRREGSGAMPGISASVP
jgi:hypothetical protein